MSKVKDKMEVLRYQGGNEYIDRFLEEDEVWWVVNGQWGRRPIEAGTAEEARDIYWNRYKKNDVEEEVLD